MQKNFLIHILILLPVILWANMVSAQSIYLGLHSHLSFNPFDPFHDHTRIEEGRYADRVAESTELKAYDVAGKGLMIGYRGIFFQELSIELRQTDYSFSPKNGSQGRQLKEQALIAFGRTPQIHLGELFFGSFYGGGGMGTLKNASHIKEGVPLKYKSTLLIAGFEFYKKLNEFSYTPHRFFVEYVHEDATSDTYQDMTVGGAIVFRREELITRHLIFGYTISL